MEGYRPAATVRIGGPDAPRSRSDAARFHRPEPLPGRSWLRPEPGGAAALQGVRRGAAPADRRAGLGHAGVRARPLTGGASTTHYSVVDAEGNAVSCTTTLNNSYGSAVTVTGAGFLLNDEMDDFATSPGQPNMYGLVQGEANAIAPGKRMLSAMTPSIVLDPGQATFICSSAPRADPRSSRWSITSSPT